MAFQRHRRLTVAAALVAVFSVPVALAEVYLDKIATTHPAIHWFEGPFDNPVERLQQKLDAGLAKLEYRDATLTYLPSLLENLESARNRRRWFFPKPVSNRRRFLRKIRARFISLTMWRLGSYAAQT